MSEELALELRAQLRELNASLKERCPQRLKMIEDNANDIDAAHSKIRKLEIKAAVFALVVSLLTPAITGILVKALVR